MPSKDTAVQRDTGKRQNVPYENAALPDRRRGTDLPVHIASSSALAAEIHDYLGIRRGGQRCAHLEDPLRVGIPLSVQLQAAGQLRRCRKAVNSGNELHSAQIHASEGSATMGPRGLIVGGCQTPLSRSRQRAGLEVQFAHHLRRLDSFHRGRRRTAYVTDYECLGADVRYAGATQQPQIYPPSQD